MASVRSVKGKRGTVWYARIRRASGQRTEVALPEDTRGKRHAQRLADELEATEERVRLGLKAAATTETLEQAAQRYLNAIRHLKSWKNSESRWRLLIQPELGKVLVQQLRPTQVEALEPTLAEKGYSPWTQRHCQMFLSGLYEWLRKDGTVDDNPVKRAKLVRKPKGSPKALTQDEVLRLSAAATFQGLADLILACFYTAARPGEMLAAQPKDFDLKSGHLHITRTLGSSTTKTGRDRWAALPPAAVALFSRILSERPHGPLFLNASGGRLTLRHAERGFLVAVRHAGFVSGWAYRCVTKGARKGCGFSEVVQQRRSTACRCGKTLAERAVPMELCLKDMRSSAATIIAETVGIRVAQKQLGHTRVETTEAAYVKDRPQHIAEAIRRAYGGPPSPEQDPEPVIH